MVAVVSPRQDHYPSVNNLPTQPLYQALPSIKKQMDGELPNECVGLLWSDGTTTKLINQARSPSRFSVGGMQFLEAIERVDPDVKTLAAFYHSHPGGMLKPSSEDEQQIRLQFAAGVFFPWLIVAPHLNFRSGFSWWWWDLTQYCARGDIHAD